MKRWFLGSLDRANGLASSIPAVAIEDTVDDAIETEISTLSITVGEITVTESELVPASTTPGLRRPRRRHTNPRPTRRERSCPPVWAMPIETEEWRTYLDGADLDALTDALADVILPSLNEIDLR